MSVDSHRQQSGLAYLSRTSSLPTGSCRRPGFVRSPPSLTLVARLGSTDSGVVTISNPGSATANLILNSLPFSGTARASSRAAARASSAGARHGAGAPGCTVVVTYTPSALGAQNGTLTINHNAPGSPSTVTLTATGTQSLISPTSSTLDFANVQQGVPKVLNLAVSNTGTASLNFTVSPSPAADSGAAAADMRSPGVASWELRTCGRPSPAASIVTLTPSALRCTTGDAHHQLRRDQRSAGHTLTGTGVACPSR